jgi:hypothetical protein
VQEGDTLQAKFNTPAMQGACLLFFGDAKRVSAIAQKVKTSHKSGKQFSNLPVQLEALVVTVWSREPSAQLHLVLQLTMQDASQRACRICPLCRTDGWCWFCYLVIWTGSVFFFQPILVLFTKITVAGTYVLQHVFWGDYYHHKETKDLRTDPNLRIEQKVKKKGTTNTL